MTNAERVQRLFKAEAAGKEGEKGQLWVNLDYAFDPLWMRHLIRNPGLVLCDNDVPVMAYMVSADKDLAEGRKPANARIIEYRSEPEVYDHALRKLATPFLAILTKENVRAIERQTYFGAYKGVTDILTKYLWPELALVLTRVAARLGMTPNMVTALGAIACIAATYLFCHGQFWWGMASAFIFMVFDTVDGKLARCTITSSYWGNIFDHGLDLVHPPFWWVAWSYGLIQAGLPLSSSQWAFVLTAILGGYVAQRIIEGIFIHSFGQHIHVWRRIDSQFRLITARRNPNMILLFIALLAGRPDWGILAVAWWTIISLLVHLIQLAQAANVKAAGGEIVSWLESERRQN